jgi:tRNA(Ser,Leu) C12 N-acetylase TAN1
MGKMKSFKEFSQDEKLVEQYNTEALNFLQRLQKSRIMKRIKHKIQRGAKLARRKIVSDPDKLMKRAIKQQRTNIAKKLLKGVSLSSISVARKIEIGKKLDKMKGRIYKLAKKLLPSIRKKEKNKFKDKVA